MTKEERKSYVSSRAVELAQSGKHSSYQTIEIAIGAEGYPEARDWLDDHAFRDYLDRLCERTTKKQP
jgi:hypothetical protein